MGAQGQSEKHQRAHRSRTWDSEWSLNLALPTWSCVTLGKPPPSQPSFAEPDREAATLALASQECCEDRMISSVCMAVQAAVYKSSVTPPPAIHALGDPLPLSWAGPRVALLVKRSGQNERCHSEPPVQKTVPPPRWRSLLLACSHVISPPSSLSLALSAAGSEEASCHAGEAHVAGN